MKIVSDVVSKRISRSSEIRLKASADIVFPLFDPVNEKKWVKGWVPRFVFPTDEVVKEQMIFTTPARFVNEDDYQWVIIKYLPDQNYVQYLVSTRDRIWTIEVACTPKQDETLARITYTFTGITEVGNELNDTALSMMYQLELKDWENAINHYLLTGQKSEH